MPRRESFALSERIRLRLVYHDESMFGSAISGRCERELRRRFAVLHGYRAKYGLAQLVREGPKVLQRVLAACLQGIRIDADHLNPHWLYPAVEATRPARLQITRNLDDMVGEIELPARLVADLASYLGDWQRGACAPARPAARTLWNALRELDVLQPVGTTRPPAPDRGVQFVGHASLRIDDGRSQILIDPFLQPRSELYPADWQPWGLDQRRHVDGILITHSHPDHFDIGSLLRCGAETPIYVPKVARESVLAIDMAARLRELGFSQVKEIQDLDRFSQGELRIQALPFNGEQPTVDDVLHPEVRNHGATYLIEAAGQQFAVLADAGRDASGEIGKTAARACRDQGPVDTIFGCYRGFALYPVQYVFSSVCRYLPFVPEASWGVRQQIMCDADDLIDLAERWSARRVVPYAAGGAPWHWLIGLGPCLDDSMADTISTDPPPSIVVEAAAHRGSNRHDGLLASPVQIEPMRVGDTLALARV